MGEKYTQGMEEGVLGSPVVYLSYLRLLDSLIFSSSAVLSVTSETPWRGRISACIVKSGLVLGTKVWVPEECVVGEIVNLR